MLTIFSVMRDYKITLFEAREDDLTAEIAEKDAQMAELEVCLAFIRQVAR